MYSWAGNSIVRSSIPTSVPRQLDHPGAPIAAVLRDLPREHTAIERAHGRHAVREIQRGALHPGPAEHAVGEDDRRGNDMAARPKRDRRRPLLIGDRLVAFTIPGPRIILEPPVGIPAFPVHAPQRRIVTALRRGRVPDERDRHDQDQRQPTLASTRGGSADAWLVIMWCRRACSTRSRW